MVKESWIWKHLTKVDEKTIKCGICPKTFARTGGNGALVYHLKNAHSLSDPEQIEATKKRDAGGRAVSSYTKNQSQISSFFTTGRECGPLRAHRLQFWTQYLKQNANPKQVWFFVNHLRRT